MRRSIIIAREMRAEHSAANSRRVLRRGVDVRAYREEQSATDSRTWGYEWNCTSCRLGAICHGFKNVLRGGTKRELRDNAVAELSIAHEPHAIASILAGLCCVAWCVVRPRTPMPLCCAV